MTALRNELKEISDLISSMVVEGASGYDLEKAIEHSRNIIDAVRSERENDIPRLKATYMIKEENRSEDIS